jgi:hypothetical protein
MESPGIVAVVRFFTRCLPQVGGIDGRAHPQLDSHTPYLWRAVRGVAGHRHDPGRQARRGVGPVAEPGRGRGRPGTPHECRRPARAEREGCCGSRWPSSARPGLRPASWRSAGRPTTIAVWPGGGCWLAGAALWHGVPFSLDFTGESGCCSSHRRRDSLSGYTHSVVCWRKLGVRPSGDSSACKARTSMVVGSSGEALLVSKLGQ